MADLIIRPAGDPDWGNALFLTGDLPLNNVDAVALGMTLGTDYEIARVGDLATFQVAAPPGDTLAPVVNSISYSAPDLTVDLTEASGTATLVWATAAPSEDPTFTIANGWSGSTYETGNFDIDTGGDTATIALTDTTPAGARELTIHFHDGSGNLSAVERVAFTMPGEAEPPATSDILDGVGDFSDAGDWGDVAGEMEVTGGQLAVTSTTANFRRIANTTPVPVGAGVDLDFSVDVIAATSSRFRIAVRPFDAAGVSLTGGSLQYIYDTNADGSFNTTGVQTKAGAYTTPVDTATLEVTVEAVLAGSSGTFDDLKLEIA